MLMRGLKNKTDLIVLGHVVYRMQAEWGAVILGLCKEVIFQEKGVNGDYEARFFRLEIWMPATI